MPSLAERIVTLERQLAELRIAVQFLAAAEELRKAKPPEKITKQKATLDEVLAFCTSIDLPATDAEWFFSKCEGNGWTNAGKAIRNWQQTIRSWKLSKYLPSLKQPGSYNGHQKNSSSPPGALNAGRYGARPGA